MKGTTASGHDVQTELPVLGHPCLPVGLDVDQVTGRVGEHVGVAFVTPLAPGGGRDDAANTDRYLIRTTGTTPGSQLDDGVITLADGGYVGPGLKILMGMVADIGAGDNDIGAQICSRRAHAQCRFPHAGQAHLRQEVEVIVEEHHQRGLLGGQHGFEVCFALSQHGVEEGDGMAGAA